MVVLDQLSSWPGSGTCIAFLAASQTPGGGRAKPEDKEDGPAQILSRAAGTPPGLGQAKSMPFSWDPGWVLLLF